MRTMSRPSLRRSSSRFSSFETNPSVSQCPRRFLSTPALRRANVGANVSTYSTTVVSSQSAFSLGIPQRTYANFPPHKVLGLPALSPTMSKGNLMAWAKKEGDKIVPGDAIAEVETDKAVMDWESTDEGYVAKILIPKGTRDVPVGKTVLIICEEEEDVAKFKDFEPSNEVAAAAAPTPAPVAAAPTPTPTAPTTPPPAPAQAQPSGVSFAASPYARKVAGDIGVDLSALSGRGTGPNDRIIAADVLDYQAAAQASRQVVSTGQYTDIPHSNIRRVTARRLTESKQTIPHYYLTVECRVDKLLKVREELNAKADNKYKLSLNDFVIKASALALKKQPVVNSSWSDDFIRRYHNVDINVAVNTPEGLFTPVVADADRKGLISISTNVKELAQKAKDKKLQPKDYEGGTFTISNLGMFGIKHFAAVINPPQAAILAVGGTERRLIPTTDAAAAKTKPYEDATFLTVTLSCDHRVVDGAVGAEWLQSFRTYVEDPLKMLL